MLNQCQTLFQVLNMAQHTITLIGLVISLKLRLSTLRMVIHTFVLKLITQLKIIYLVCRASSFTGLLSRRPFLLQSRILVIRND